MQERRILIKYHGDGEAVPLQREQFETLGEHVAEGWGGFGLDRLSPDAKPHVTVLSLHPRFKINDWERIISEGETPTSSPLVEAHKVNSEKDGRDEPDIPVYADLLSWTAQSNESQRD